MLHFNFRFRKFCAIKGETLRIKHNSGLFSNCSISVYGIVSYFNQYKRLPAKVDFADTFKNFSSGEQEEAYKSYFKPQSHIDITYRDKVRFPAISLFDYRSEAFDQLTPFVNRYFSPSDAVMLKVDALIERYNIIPQSTIAVCYRGTDKHRDTGLASFEDFITQAQSIKQRFPDHRMLIQTDQAQFWETSTQVFSDAFRFEETPFTATDKVMHDIIKEEDKKEWTQWFIAAVIVISRCAYVVNHTGNVARWICLYRKGAHNMSQYFRKRDAPRSGDYWI